MDMTMRHCVFTWAMKLFIEQEESFLLLKDQQSLSTSSISFLLFVLFCFFLSSDYYLPLYFIISGPKAQSYCTASQEVRIWKEWCFTPRFIISQYLPWSSLFLFISWFFQALFFIHVTLRESALSLLLKLYVPFCLNSMSLRILILGKCLLGHTYIQYIYHWSL